MKQRLNRKAQVWIYRKGQVLLLQTNVERGEFWQPVTGSINAGETFAEGAMREAQEESGLVFDGELKYLEYEFEFHGKFGRVIERVFAWESSRGEVKLEPREHQNYRWISFAEAEKALKFSSNIEGLHRLQKRLEKGD